MPTSSEAARAHAVNPTLPSPAPGAGGEGRVTTLGWLMRKSWLVVVMGGLLLVVGAADFRAPAQVRIDDAQGAEIVGDAPSQEFPATLGNSRATALRVTVKHWPRGSRPSLSPDDEIDARAQLLSQPLVTTLLGTSATVEQTIRLDRGALALELSLEMTPREHGKRETTLLVDYALQVHATRSGFLSRQQEPELVALERGTLARVENDGHRAVLNVDGHLISIDLEMRRSGG